MRFWRARRSDGTGGGEESGHDADGRGAGDRVLATGATPGSRRTPGSPGSPGWPGSPGSPPGGLPPWPAAPGSPQAGQRGGRLRAFFRDRFGSWGGAPIPGEDLGPPHPLMHASANPWSRLTQVGRSAEVGTLLKAEFGETRLTQELGRLFASLGSTPGELAGSLEGAGVRAQPGDPAASPVRLFLAAVVGADPNVKALRVEGGELVVDLRAWWRPTVSVPLPPVVRSFEIAFEAGCYPSLAPGERRGGHRACGPEGPGSGAGAGASKGEGPEGRA